MVYSNHKAYILNENQKENFSFSIDILSFSIDVKACHFELKSTDILSF